jgi:hypothetical protein
MGMGMGGLPRPLRLLLREKPSYGLGGSRWMFASLRTFHAETLTMGQAVK